MKPKTKLTQKRGLGKNILKTETTKTVDTENLQEWKDDKNRLHRPENQGPALIRKNQNYQAYYKHGKLHRDNGPALQTTQTTIYYQNGELHREKGPAIKTENKDTYYYKHGKLHRDNGPALQTYANEKQYTRTEQYYKQPSIIQQENNIDHNKPFYQAYYQKGILHNEKEPAKQWQSGSYEHYQNGKLHNEKGPATYYSQTQQHQYWLNGKQYTQKQHQRKTKPSLIKTIIKKTK